MRRRRWVAPVGLGVIAVLTALIASGTHGAEAGPTGTLAFERFVVEMGLNTTREGRPPAGGTLILLADLRPTDQARELLDDARAGRRIVVADPASTLAAELDVTQTSAIGGIAPHATLEARCPLVTARRLRVSARAQLLLGPRHATACFEGFLVSVPIGRGSVVFLADTSPLTNELLRRDDNAVLAYELAAPGPVVLGPPVEQGRHRPCVSAWTCLPTRGRAVVVQIAVAALVYVAVRARRVGRPAPELLPAPIPAGELVRATARLYRAAGAREEVAQAIRASATTRWARQLGSGRAPDVSSVARAAGMEERRIDAALTGPTRDDDELISLGRELAGIDERIGR